MFNDLLNIEDSIVAEYKGISDSFRSDSTVSIIDINDFYTGGSTEANRGKIMRQFGYTWERMEQEILFNPDVSFLYRGMLKFMSEETCLAKFCKQKSA